MADYNGYLDADQTIVNYAVREMGGTFAQTLQDDPSRMLRNWRKCRKNAQGTAIGTTLFGALAVVAGAFTGAGTLLIAGVAVAAGSGFLVKHHSEGAAACELESEILDSCRPILGFLVELERRGANPSDLVSLYDRIVRAASAKVNPLDVTDKQQLQAFFQAELEQSAILSNLSGASHGLGAAMKGKTQQPAAPALNDVPVEDGAKKSEQGQVSPNQFEPIEPPTILDIPVEDVPSLQPPSTQPATSEPPDDRFAWARDLLHFPAVLIWGAQGSGKTSFAAWLLHQRIAAGHSAWVCDPHKEYGQWNGLKCVGAGMDYEACDRAMIQFANTVKREYKTRSEQANYQPQRESVLVEEFTNWANRCENAGEFFAASLSDLRKIKKGVIFVSHDRSLIALGNAKGFSKARNNGLLELHLEAVIDPVTGDPKPAMRGKLKLPGKAAIEVEISPEMCGSMDFTRAIGVEAPAAVASDEQQRLRDRLEGLYRGTTANDPNETQNAAPNDARTKPDAVPEQPNDPNEIRTNFGTDGTTQPQGLQAFDFSPERIAERFGGTNERTLFEVVQEGFANGLAPNEIVKQSLKLGRDRYQEGKALSVYLVRKYGNFDLFQHFRKWLEE